MDEHMAAQTTLALLVAIGVIAAFCSIKVELRRQRQGKREQRRQEQVALSLHPVYQQQRATDQAHELQSRKQLAEEYQFAQEFSLKRYTARHHVPAEMYIVGEEPGRITALPSLKAAPSAGGQVGLASQEALPEAPRFREMVSLVQPPSSIPLCWTADGAKMGTFRDLLSMGLIGRPERGKTTALLYYVCVLLLVKAEIWVWDLHGSMSALRGLNYFDSFSSIIDSIPALHGELEERDELYHEEPRRYKHPFVLLVDELPALAGRYNALDRQVRRATPSPLLTAQTFALEARKWKGYAFLAGQSLPYDVLPTLARDNLSSRIIFECSADHARQMQLQKMAIETMLPRLRGAPRGTHIADFSTWSAPLLADIPFTDEDDLAWVLARCGAVTPDTSRVSRERDTGSLSDNGDNVVAADWESGDSRGDSPRIDTAKCQVSPQDYAAIVAAARAQLAETRGDKVVISKLIDAQPGWNKKWWNKIKYVLEQEGL